MSKPQKHATAKRAIARASDAVAALKADAKEAADAAVLERKMSIQESNANEIRRIEDEIHLGAMDVVDGSISGFSLSPEDTEPPKEWIEAFGEKRAWIRFRAARAGQLNAKEAPVAIKVATQIMTGITKARSMEKAAPRSLNVAFVQMSPELLPQFPEQIVEKK